MTHASQQPRMPASILRHEHGVTTVDADYVRPRFASVHVLERQGEAALVDTGTNHSVPRVLDALRQLQLPPEAVQWVFVTHVHLDHAGGAGSLLRELPNARIVAHPRAVPHLADPTVLAAATAAVYGQAAFEQLYGSLLPAASDRIVATRDGERLLLGSSEFEVLHTPGHALHHHALYDRAGSCAFTGDTFGLSYREMDTAAGPFIVPTTTPTQFDPEQLARSVRRIAALQPEAVYLTHYGRVTGVARLARSLQTQIERFVEIAEASAGADQPEARIREAIGSLWGRLLGEHGVEAGPERVEHLLGPDLTLNAQGLVAWLERKARSR